MNTGRPEAGAHYAALYNEAQFGLSALWEELARKDVVIEDMLQSNSDMTSCLASAEQRNTQLSGFLERMLKGCGSDLLAAWQSEMEMVLTDAALKPAESVASE